MEYFMGDGASGQPLTDCSKHRKFAAGLAVSLADGEWECEKRWKWLTCGSGYFLN